MIAAVQQLRIWVFSMEVPGSNAEYISSFFDIFMHLLYTTVTILSEYFDSAIYSCLVLPCNSIAINVIYH